MFGFSFYQSKQYEKQAEAQAIEQARLDSIAMVELAMQAAADSANVNSGETTAVKVKLDDAPVYKDSLLNAARNAQEQIIALANDKI